MRVDLVAFGESVPSSKLDYGRISASSRCLLGELHPRGQSEFGVDVGEVSLNRSG